jgi:type VI secretion system Hcp family effector
MAVQTYMLLKGRTQGVLTGEVDTAGYAGWILVNDVRWAISTPFDATSGLPSGHKAAEPLAVSVPTGRHTPLVLKAHQNDEALTEAKIHFVHTSNGGTPVLTYEMVMTNGYLTSFETNLQGGSSSSPFDNYLLTFENIQLNWSTSTTTISSTAAPSSWSATS